VFHGLRDVHVFGICDGHGVNGKQVSSFIKKELPILFAHYLESTCTNDSEEFAPTPDKIKSALEKAFEETNSMLYNLPFDIKFSGST
jgi:serine/threonine protein phosphatase PrpC